MTYRNIGDTMPYRFPAAVSRDGSLASRELWRTQGTPMQLFAEYTGDLLVLPANPGITS